MVNRLCVQLNSLTIEQSHVPFPRLADLSVRLGKVVPVNSFISRINKTAKIEDKSHDKSGIRDTTSNFDH